MRYEDFRKRLVDAVLNTPGDTPEAQRRAVLERRFSETFREEMTQAKDLIGRRFPDMPDRMAVLAEALKEQIALERSAAARSSAESRA